MGNKEWIILCFEFVAMLSLVVVFLPISRIYDWKVSLFRKWGWNNFASGLEKQRSWAPVIVKNGIGILGMICVPIPLVWLLTHHFCYVISGKMFHSRFDRFSEWNGVGAIRVSFIYFTFFAATALTYIAIVRCRIDRSYSLLYWLFLIITAVICVFLLSLLTCGMGKMIIYIRDMGFTQKRIYGLIYGLYWYVIVLEFLYWAAIRRPIKKKSS